MELGDQDRKFKVVRAEDMFANCMLKYCLPLKIFVPNLVDFSVLLGNALSCNLEEKAEVYADHCFMPKIMHLPGGGHCPLARDNQISLKINVIEFVCANCSY